MRVMFLPNACRALPACLALFLLSAALVREGPAIEVGERAPLEAPPGRRRVYLGPVAGPDRAQNERVRKLLADWLSRSDGLQVVGNGGDYRFRGALRPGSAGEVSLVVSDPARNLAEEVSGSPEDLAFLVEQLANRLAFRITGRWLPVDGATPRSVEGGAKGEAAGALPGTPERLVQAAGGGRGPVEITLSVDRGPNSTYRFGDKLTITAKTDRDCYLTLYSIDARGAVTILFPNQFVPDHYVRAGRSYTVPGPDEPWEIKVGGTPGMETILAIATLRPVELPGAEGKQRAITAFSKSITAFSRSLQIKLKTEVRQQETGVSSAAIRFYTLKEPGR